MAGNRGTKKSIVNGKGHTHAPSSTEYEENVLILVSHGQWTENAGNGMDTSSQTMKGRQ
jgi:hypothetical protein